MARQVRVSQTAEAIFLIALLWLWVLFLLTFSMLHDVGYFLEDPDYDTLMDEAVARRGDVWSLWLGLSAGPAIGVGGYGYVRLAVIRRLARLANEAPTCLRCGYLLVGLTSDRCPECGQQHPDEEERRRNARASAVRAELMRIVLATVVLCTIVMAWSNFLTSTRITPAFAVGLVAWWLVYGAAGIEWKRVVKWPG